MIWVQIIWFVVSLIISVALAPKPPKPRAAALEDFDLPIAEENRPVPVLFGGPKEITGPNILWYGDLKTKAIKKRSGFSKSTVGYKYSIGWHMGLSIGPVDEMSRIRVAEKEVWGPTLGNDPITESGFGSISQKNIFGGDSREGGIEGFFDVAMGETTQTANSYLVSKIGAPVPAYRGLFSFIWRGYIGTTPYAKPWGISASRYFKGWFNNSVWYSAKVQNANGMNPAHVIYQALTDPRYGEGSSTSNIDEDSFEYAADLLHDEEFGITMLWNQPAAYEDFIGIVLDHIGGLLTFNRLTNKYGLVLIRGDYDALDLSLLDSSIIKEVTSFQRRSWGETVNELTLVYTDPITQKDTAVTLQDLGNINSQMAKITEKVSLVGITNRELAVRVCGRELAAKCTPLARITFTADRSTWPFKQGHVVRITYAAHNLNQTVFRIVQVRGGTLQNGTITIDAVEDIYALSGLEYIVPSEPTTDEIEPATPPDDSQGNIVTSVTQTAPPVTPIVGTRFVVPSSPTGDWEDYAGKLVEYDPDDEAADANGWVVVEIPGGELVYVEDTGTFSSIVDGVDMGAPWTPETGALTLDTDPEAGSFIPVLTSDGYRKVALATVRAGDIQAEDVDYDDSQTNLGASDVQGAIVQLVASQNKGIVWVRAFAGGLFRGQAGLTFVDSPDGDNWTERNTQNVTSLNGLITFNGKYFATANNYIGSSTDIYGAWDYVKIDTLPVRGISGGFVWSGLKAIDGILYAISNFPVPGILIQSDDNGITWEETGIPLGLEEIGDSFQQISGVFRDDLENRWIVFTTLSRTLVLGTPIQVNLPQVYESTDLVNFSFISDLISNRATQSGIITGIVQRVGADLLPQDKRYLMYLRTEQGIPRVTHEFADGADRIKVIRYLNSGLYVVNIVRYDSLGASIDSVAIVSPGYVTNAFVVGPAIYVSYRNTTSGRTGIARVLLSTLTITHTYVSATSGDDFERACWNGTGIFFGTSNNDLTELDPNDLTEVDSFSMSITTAGWQDCDATHLYIVVPGFDIAKILLSNGSTVATFTTDSAVTFIHDLRVNSGYVYVVNNDSVTRYSTTTGIKDSGFSVDLTGNAAGEIQLSFDGNYMGAGRTRSVVSVTDLTGPTTYRGTLWGVALEVQDPYGVGLPSRASIVRSEDADTWTFPSVSWPNSDDGRGLVGLIWDGERFITSGRGFTATSIGLTAWSFSDPDFADSGIVETAFLELVTNGSGLTTGVASNSNGRVLQSFSEDGLVWTTANSIPSADASDIKYDDSVTMFGETNVQDALEAVKILVEAVETPVLTRSATWLMNDGTAITTPSVVVYLRIPVDSEIQKVSILTLGGIGNCEIAIWKDDFSSFPPTSGDSICGSSPPIISSGKKYEDSVLSGWNTTLDAGDVLALSVVVSDVFTHIFLQLEIKPT